MAKWDEVVSRGVHDQVRWERDVAIRQLEEHGIPFGGIAPDVVKVVRCKDCKYFYRHTQIDTDRGDCWCYGIGNLRVKHIEDYCSKGENRETD